MKRQLFILLLLLVPPVVYAQTDTAKLDIPMQGGMINYEAKALIKSRSVAAARDKAIQWMVKHFPANKTAAIKKRTDVIIGEGIFRVNVNRNGNYFWLKFEIDITMENGSYTLNVYDFYEKPIEKGISNEYSKIGYRWWDYRRGHPWSAEDKPLFIGLDKKSRALLASFKTAMEQ
ncbi:hypothetical protein EWM62_00140 [Mucilaginibacter terrigena]|uniref:DUF4468 domain-containing protein n=1 Tax=Mucilaginibacter terrigena TaxID=2492395 RepID=A0A4Q5LRB8_9SPHI|nr:hypothetical protein [Mucilaginibacter terrigena]RYU91889.1 hypothetical protein EWM62_00140 [Mucilaginibacter terrigena]